MLTVTPALAVQRSIYDRPRGRERFRSYLRELTGGTDDLVLPLAAQNPMGRAHCAAALDRLIDLDAEEVARAAVEEFVERRGSFGDHRVVLVLVDDAEGGWTDRDLTDVRHRFEPAAEMKRGWVTVNLYTGDFSDDRPAAADVRRAVLVTLHERAAWLEGGAVATLGDRMRRVGAALAFAGAEEPAFDDEVLARLRSTLAPHLDSDTFSDVFACLYGDEAAARVGYPPLGLPRFAGFAVALADARG